MRDLMILVLRDANIRILFILYECERVIVKHSETNEHNQWGTHNASNQRIDQNAFTYLFFTFRRTEQKHRCIESTMNKVCATYSLTAFTMTTSTPDS